jgi:6-phosphogluconolactonase (cycloisomerase 2 family)
VNNSVISFEIGQDGILRQAYTIGTQGQGSGYGLNTLNSQGALTISENKQWIIATNAKSNEISIFKITQSGLTFASKSTSYGQYPVSLTAHNDMVFVLNKQGSIPNIIGFSIDKQGNLIAVGSTLRYLPPLANYSQVGISPNGKWLVICAESISTLFIYNIHNNNIADAPRVLPLASTRPSAFVFDKNNNLLITETANNTVSSYRLSDENIDVITPSMPTGHRTPRWIVYANNYAYVTNTGDGSVSTLAVSNNGQLSTIQNIYLGNITEITVSSDGKYLYALSPQTQRVLSCQIGENGTLTEFEQIDSFFSIYAQGIVAN